jgi:hypothetical protein
MRRATIGLGFGVLASLLGATPAVAATPPAVTSQARAANAAFLAYAPPPASPGALCLVDTGVDGSADTTPEVVYSTALDGGNPADNDPEGHGTLMAMLAGGQGHGIRGIWPQIKIVSIRETTSTVEFKFHNFVEGLTTCYREAHWGVKVVNLSLGSSIPTSPNQTEAFEQEASRLTERGIAIVAAAGNTPGPLAFPAAEAQVLPIGAASPAGGQCSFSASEGVALWAPGCEIEFANPFTDEFVPTAWVQGTSQASVIASAALTALMSYAPTLTVAQAESDLLASAGPSHQLNVAAAFELAGLGSVVQAGNAAIPTEQPPPPIPATPAPTLAPPAVAKPPRASIKRLSFYHRRLHLVLKVLPAGDRLHLRARCGRVRARSAAKPFITLTCRRPRHATVWLTDSAGAGPRTRVGVHSSGRSDKHSRHSADKRHQHRGRGR